MWDEYSKAFITAMYLLTSKVNVVSFYIKRTEQIQYKISILFAYL